MRQSGFSDRRRQYYFGAMVLAHFSFIFCVARRPHFRETAVNPNQTTNTLHDALFIPPSWTLVCYIIGSSNLPQGCCEQSQEIKQQEAVLCQQGKRYAELDIVQGNASR